MHKKIFLFVTLAFLPAILFAQDKLELYGYVKAAITKQDLIQSKLIFYDNEGNAVDSVMANNGLIYRYGQMDTTSLYSFEVPRVDSTYVFDVVCPGYQTFNMSYTVDNIGKRERSREIPIIYLNREVRLREVTVKATKIKFYNDGDTIVYDASAFQLQEGSMLDDLIANLPGVELSTDGQIKVNGQFVESLLLDGKKFFDGNNNLLLENIAAYTVKNIKVYEGVSKEDEVMGRFGNKVLTMDVRLKKEYNIGWIINAQGGIGTDDRYIGRLFAAWFNPKWRISLIGNANNLNDNRHPGRNDTWTPDQMPSGRVRNAIIGLEYNYDNPDNGDISNGNFTITHSNNDIENRTDRTNFLSGGNTYDKSFSNSYSKNTSVTLNNWSSFSRNNFSYGESFSAAYSNYKNSSSSLAGTFTENQDSITWATLDAIYSAGNQQLLETIINRSKTMTDGWTKSYSISFLPFMGYRRPKSSDSFSFDFGGSYQSQKRGCVKMRDDTAL